MENNLITMDPESIVKEFLFQRNSPIARMELGKELMEHYEGVNDIEVTSLMTNKNVEMLEAYLFQMGYELRCEYDVLDLTDEPGIKTHLYNGRKYICTSDEMRHIIARDIVKIRYEETGADIYLGTVAAFEDFCDKVATEIERQIEEYMM
jgi:hypothetical protein